MTSLRSCVLAVLDERPASRMWRRMHCGRAAACIGHMCELASFHEERARRSQLCSPQHYSAAALRISKKR